MDSDAILDIKKGCGDIALIDIREAYPDEVHIEAKPEDFRKICLVLHIRFKSPVMMLFAADERVHYHVFSLYCVFLSTRYRRWCIVHMSIPEDNPSFESLSKSIYSAALFEREINEMFGVEPKGNPDMRRLRLHDEVWPNCAYPLRKDFQEEKKEKYGTYTFLEVKGDGIFEVPVGPVHAGIIGPGHFRFSVAGEPIINLETRFGFTHRGVEKLFEGKAIPEAIAVSECVSGDSSFAHSLALVRAAEKIAGVETSEDTEYLRGIFLELERMYNHVNDVGGISVDVGFSFPAAYATLLKERILRLNDQLTGHRYLKHINSIGYMKVNMQAEQKQLFRSCLNEVMRDFQELVKMLTSSVSFMDRVDGAGLLRRKTAEDLGIVGLVARASGISSDLRKYFPGVYQKAGFKVMSEESGDVLARFKVRIYEFEESARLINEFLAKISGNEMHKPLVSIKGGSALGYAEGWRGPVLYWLKINESGCIERCKIVDPSFQNWQGLSFAVLGNIIPDFPLCNKSFDLSYSGNDL